MSAPEFHSPMLRSFFRAAHTVWNRREDLRRQFESVDLLQFWAWAITTGLDEAPELSERWPTPPAERMARVVGGSDPRHFRDSAVSDAFNLLVGLERAGVRPDQEVRVLDFGCGCGRILSAFARLTDHWSLVGADVDAAAVEWCTQHLDYAQLHTLDEIPPTPFSDGEFDAVVAFSVFSHLPEANQEAWLREMGRILRPGGTLVATVQGLRCFERCAHGEFPDIGLPPPESLIADRARLERDGFVYYPYRDGRPWTDESGMSFQHESYVRTRWPDRFEILEVRLAPQDWQDYVTARWSG